MRLAILRAVVMMVSAAGIIGMILGSVADNNNGVVITCGLVSAVGILVLIAVTAATPPSNANSLDLVDEVVAAQVEARLEALVADGVDEGALRELVRDAVRLGRSTRPAPSHAGPRPTGTRSPPRRH